MVLAVKAAARAAGFAARRLAFGEGQGRAADHLAAVLAGYRGATVAGYMPMRTEIDPLPAMAGHDGAVGVPVIMGADQALQFRRWHMDAQMEVGAFGAMIPKTGDWIIPQVVIVPLVGFDAQGYRLGYGGGFYDRTLEGLRAKGPVVAIGFAFAAQEMPQVPIEPTDQKLDMIVTENGARHF